MSYEGMTVEGAAMELLDRIAKAEGKSFGDAHTAPTVDRPWILSAYGQCVKTVRGQRVTIKSTQR